MQTEDKIRTRPQQNALEVYCRKVAKWLNDRKLFMKILIFDRVITARWHQQAVKDGIWRPLQIAIAEKVSTADASTRDYPQVYEQMSALLAEMGKGDIPPAWPTRWDDDLRSGGDNG